MNHPVGKVETLRWVGDEQGFLVLIDQTKLPADLVDLECHDIDSVWHAIKRLSVRGAPAIGIAAAYGMVIGLQEHVAKSLDAFQKLALEQADYLATSRPTAVNLFWALDRLRHIVQQGAVDANALLGNLLREARNIHDEDRRMCHAIGAHGADLLGERTRVLTHCNAGGLATAEYGTALSVFFTAQDRGRTLQVFVDETRPLLQGARLTAWELMQRGIDATLICDSMAAQVMREGKVDAVVTGADRIAANGDSANKIGTYALAILAKHHEIPFFVAAPSSTFDLSIQSGDEIPIELRAADEITAGFGTTTAPEGVAVYNPAFDVTPADLIDAIITERGVIQPVLRESILELMGAV